MFHHWSVSLFHGVTCILNRRLSTDFTIHFGEIHNIQIVQWPENIKLQVRNFVLCLWFDWYSSAFYLGLWAVLASRVCKRCFEFFFFSFFFLVNGIWYTKQTCCRVVSTDSWAKSHVWESGAGVLWVQQWSSGFLQTWRCRKWWVSHISLACNSAILRIFNLSFSGYFSFSNLVHVSSLATFYTELYRLVTSIYLPGLNFTTKMKTMQAIAPSSPWANQFIQLGKRSLKKIRASTGFESENSLKPWIFFRLLFPNYINWLAHGEDRAIACFSPPCKIISFILPKWKLLIINVFRTGTVWPLVVLYLL